MSLIRIEISDIYDYACLVSDALKEFWYITYDKERLI